MEASARPHRLRLQLLHIGGVDVDFIDDPYLQLITDVGEPFTAAEVHVKPGRPHECHRNAALFWLKGRCDAIATGYYLGPDGVWRQHSWGVKGDGTIVDTHSAGQRYFGVSLESMEAVQFAEDHIGVIEVLRFMKKNPERFRPIIEKARRSLIAPY